MNNIIISSIVPHDIICELEKLGFKCIKAGKSQNIYNETAYHPDMLFFKLSSGELLVEKGFAVNNLDIFFRINQSRGRLANKYPMDCIFNCFYAENNLICGKSVAEEILNDAAINEYKVITVKQGYAACSTVRLNNTAYITADNGIAAVLKSLGYDVLVVSNSGISLNGYSNGFIGGCALFVHEDTVGFSGAIELHENFDSIKAFCANYKMYPYSLSDKELYDYGGGIIL